MATNRPVEMALLIRSQKSEVRIFETPNRER
jgi:hypothetical protein